jgi:hypothetical protein
VPILPAILALAGIGFVVALVRAGTKKSSGGYYIIPGVAPPPAEKLIVYEPPTTSSGSAYMPSVTIPKGFTPEVVASAKKWAAVRGVPVKEILATIYVESRGNPRAWANLASEDSRGLMQINVNAWGATLSKYGLTVEDLWDVDSNIMVGSDIYATYRKKVQSLIAQSGMPQSAPIDVLTRLYYKGPAYVQKKILVGEDASHPYKNSDAAVANWKVALVVADQVTSMA